MKIYTRTGDQGETGLFAGPRVLKDDVRIEAYGTVDELNNWLGMARVDPAPAPLGPMLEQLQHDLFQVGAQLATPDPIRSGLAVIQPAQVEQLEAWIDLLEADLPPLREFILPSGTRLAATLHVARGVARRAERRLVTLLKSEPAAGGDVLHYVNRLSDLLFVMARAANHLAGQAETTWRAPPREKS